MTGIISFLVTVAYVPTWMNGVIVPRWTVLLVLVPAALLLIPHIRFRVSYMVVWSLVGWCFLTLLWSGYLEDGVVMAVGMTVAAMSFMLGAEEQSARSAIQGAAAGLIVNFAAIIIQLLGNWPWFQYASPSGLFSNGNVLGELAVVVFVGAIHFRIYWAAVIAVAVFMACPSRAGVVALAAVFALELWCIGNRKWAVGLLGTLAVVGLPLLVWLNPASVQERLVLISDTLRNLSFFGNGAGSFAQEYPLFASGQTLTARPTHVHSDFLELWFEIGVPGLLLVALVLWLAMKKSNPERYILTALIVEACLGLYPLFFPHMVFLAAVVAGSGVAKRFKYGRTAGDGGDRPRKGKKGKQPVVVMGSPLGVPLSGHGAQGVRASGVSARGGRVADHRPRTTAGRRNFGLRPKFVRPAGGSVRAPLEARHDTERFERKVASSQD